MNPKGQPFVTEFSAKRKLKEAGLVDTHEVAPAAEGGYVVQPKAETKPVEAATIADAVPATETVEAAPAAADAKAIAAKQIPDMTDAELLAARDIYGTEHKRRAKVEKAIADRGIDVAGTPTPAAAPIKPPVTAGQRAKDNLKASDSFLSLLATHGIAMEDRSDTGGEEKKNRMIPGHGPIYRKTGLRLDELAAAAHADGFLTDADMASSKDNGGVNKLTDMIQRAVHGKEIVAHPGMTEQTMQNEAETRELNALADDAQHYGIDTAGMSDAQLREAVHAEYAKETQAASLEEHDAISQDADTIEEAGISDEEINAIARTARSEQKLNDEEIDAQLAENSAQEVGQGTADGNDAKATRASSARTEAAPGSTQAAGTEGFGLTGETTAEGRARVAGEEQAAADKAKVEKDAASAERAGQVKKEIAARQDASADNFQLGRSAEQGLSGQQDMLGETPAAKEPNTTPAAQDDTGADIPKAFWKKVKVDHDVWVTDETRYESVSIPSDKALASVREDLTHLRSLLACMKG